MLSLWRFVLRPNGNDAYERETVLLICMCGIVALLWRGFCYIFFTPKPSTAIDFASMRECRSSYLPKAFRRTIDFNFVISLILYVLRVLFFFLFGFCCLFLFLAAYIFPLSIFFFRSRFFVDAHLLVLAWARYARPHYTVTEQ